MKAGREKEKQEGKIWLMILAMWEATKEREHTTKLIKIADS